MSAAASVQNPTEKARKLSDAALNDVLHPTPDKTFTVKLVHGEKTFSIRVMPWVWEQEFRKAIIPLLAAEFKPFERVITIVAKKLWEIDDDLKMTEAFLGSELQADGQILGPLAAICMSQDERVLKAAAERRELSADELKTIRQDHEFDLRNAVNAKLDTEENKNNWSKQISLNHFFRDIVRMQTEKQEVIKHLGESLTARSDDYANLAGPEIKFHLNSMKQASISKLQEYSARAGSTDTTLDKSSLLSTESSSPNTSLNQVEDVVRRSEANVGEDGTKTEEVTIPLP